LLFLLGLFLLVSHQRQQSPITPRLPHLQQLKGKFASASLLHPIEEVT
jgi:hypothetical protein